MGGVEMPSTPTTLLQPMTPVSDKDLVKWCKAKQDARRWGQHDIPIWMIRRFLAEYFSGCFWSTSCGAKGWFVSPWVPKAYQLHSSQYSSLYRWSFTSSIQLGCSLGGRLRWGGASWVPLEGESSLLIVQLALMWWLFELSRLLQTCGHNEHAFFPGEMLNYVSQFEI